jgi:hypothetical protein
MAAQVSFARVIRENPRFRMFILILSGIAWIAALWECKNYLILRP